MRKFAVPLALLGASSLLALQPRQTLNCNDRHNDHDRFHYCEMREQTVSAAGGPITVDARPNGAISVKGWDRADVLVRAQVRTSGSSDAEARDLARQINVQAIGAQIHSDGPARDSSHEWSVSYEVFVPSRSTVSMQTVNGGISAADVSGGLEFQTTNGGVSLARVNGKVNGRTVNGGVSVELAGDRWTGDGMDVKTTNGGISLKVPQTFSAQLDVETVHGGLATDFPTVPPSSGRHERHISTAIGSGGAPVHLRTTNGGVSIKRI